MAALQCQHLQSQSHDDLVAIDTNSYFPLCWILAANHHLSYYFGRLYVCRGKRTKNIHLSRNNSTFDWFSWNNFYTNVQIRYDVNFVESLIFVVVRLVNWPMQLYSKNTDRENDTKFIWIQKWENNAWIELFTFHTKKHTKKQMPIAKNNKNATNSSQIIFVQFRLFYALWFRTIKTT